MKNKMKGYRSERKVRLLFEARGWEVVRAGGSLGYYDLIAFKDGKCAFLQIKSTKKNVFYYYGYKDEMFMGFPFFLVVDFGRGNIKVTKPVEKINESEGENLDIFLNKLINDLSENKP